MILEILEVFGIKKYFFFNLIYCSHTGPAVRFSSFESRSPVPPPVIGQHTVQVLRDTLGYSDDVIDRLLASRAVTQNKVRCQLSKASLGKTFQLKLAVLMTATESVGNGKGQNLAKVSHLPTASRESPGKTRTSLSFRSVASRRGQLLPMKAGGVCVPLTRSEKETGYPARPAAHDISLLLHPTLHLSVLSQWEEPMPPSLPVLRV
ncbi:hypothetical protein PO909_016697 [Leuciscus waleckii]